MAPRKKATLAKPGDPLVSRNGVLIDPELPRSAVLDKLPAPVGSPSKNSVGFEPPLFRASKRKNLNELPAPANVLNGVGAVFMYTCLGVGDREIADTLNITTMQLEELRNHSAYIDCFNIVVDELISANSDALQARIASYATRAVENIMDVAENAEKDETKLRANQDIADRAGVGAKQLAERKSGQVSSLRIMILDDDKSVNVDLNVTL